MIFEALSEGIFGRAGDFTTEATENTEEFKNEEGGPDEVWVPKAQEAFECGRGETADGRKVIPEKSEIQFWLKANG